MLADISPGRQPCKGSGVCGPHHGWGEGPALAWESFRPQKSPNSVSGAAVITSNLLLPLMLVGSGMEPDASSSLTPC